VTRRARTTDSALAVASLALAGGICACGSSSNASGPSDGGASTRYDGSVVSDAVAMDAPATPSCEAGKATSISGRVYDPAGVNPLYGVTVYIPAAMPPPFSQGVSCESCSTLYAAARAFAVTDANGNFTIKAGAAAGPIAAAPAPVAALGPTGPVPDGKGLSLIVQVGKWRKQYKIDVTACQDNPMPDKTLRLPGKHTAYEDLPQIAISTGADDSLECLLRRMGIDESEYVAGAGTPDGGHVHIFSSTGGTGGATVQGGSPDPGAALWDKLGDMTPYDLVLLSCEGAETARLDATSKQVLFDYALSGGRVFASHFHYIWFTDDGPFSTLSPPLATWTKGTQLDMDPMSGKVVTTFANGTSYPEGVALNAWLGNVGAMQNGELPIDRASDNAQITANNRGSQPWIAADQGSSFPGYAQQFSFEASPGEALCGRVVYSDLHASGLPGGSADPGADYAGTTPGVVPQGCALRPLTPQEKALEFTIFDLSSCLAVERRPAFGPP
jgi:hypothetical protein